MFVKATLIVGIFMVLVSCKKEKFPKSDDLQGTWTLQSDDSNQCRLIFEQETLYILKGSTADTLSWRLDKKQELLYLTLKSDPSGESALTVNIRRKDNALLIQDFFVAIPESTSLSVFKKE